MRKRIRRAVSVIGMTAIMLMSVFTAPTGSRAAALGEGVESGAPAGTEAGGYSSYLKEYGGAERPAGPAEINLAGYKAAASLEASASAGAEGTVLDLKGEDGRVEFEFENNAAGCYAIYIEYLPHDMLDSIGFSVLIDGAVPFKEASGITLSRPYKPSGVEFRKDAYGNDLSMEQLPAGEYTAAYLTDTTGNYEKPYQFYLTAGKHTLTLDFRTAGLSIRRLSFRKTEEAGAYAAPGGSESSGKLINLRAELPYRMSSSTITSGTDKSSAATYPNDAKENRLNVIGGSSWSGQGQWISWRFTIEEAGIYNIGFRARQNIRSGLFSARRIYIDGKVPFAELEDVRFENSMGWYNKVLGDEEPYGFYFEEGEHEIKLEVTPGMYADTVLAVSAAVAELNEYYRRIIMITGVEPDPYQDYALEESLPDMAKRFGEIGKALAAEKERLEQESGLKGSETATLTTIVTQLESFAEDPSTIPERLTAFRENISSLSAWYLELSSQPLELDQIYVYSPDVKLPKAGAGFFENIVFSIKTILASFVTDYGSVDYGEGNSRDSLKVWINTGRDQLKILNQIISDGFQQEYDAKVTLNVSAASGTELPIQQGLIEMLLAGRAPDICLFAPGSNPVDLALRNALLPLDEFEGFGEVEKRFNEQAFVPYRYGGKTYALPVTQVFNVMYYRTDILAELGLEPPETWDELFEIIPIIQSNNLEVGVPSDISTYQTMLYQKGVSVYTDDLKKTNFDTPEALEAFESWTDFYSIYSFDLTFDFFNRFRTGEMPIGISSFVTYTQIMASSPEITGLWEMTLIPGTPKADGSIDHSVTGTSAGAGGTCAFITKDTKNKELAWEFLKWFTSDDVQYDYGVRQEMVLGPTGRYATANLNAFARLPWDKEAMAVLNEQRSYIKEIPQIPGGYYVSRDLNNALRRVVLEDENPRQALNYYNLNINSELERKRIELKLDER